jgi:hypothetical protein
MQLTEVEITCTVITQEYGTLATGAILRCPKDFAEFLIHQANAAKYPDNANKTKPEEVEKEPEEDKDLHQKNKKLSLKK